MKPNAPLRGIVIKDKAWVCSDGETWHAGSPDDRLLYDWAHTPIMAGRQLPPFEKVGQEQRAGQTWLHVQLKVPEKNIDPKQLPQYWIVCSMHGAKRNTLATPRCRGFRRCATKSCTARSIMRLPRKRSRRRHSGRRSMTRRMVFTISSNINLIGRARLFASR